MILLLWLLGFTLSLVIALGVWYVLIFKWNVLDLKHINKKIAP